MRNCLLLFFLIPLFFAPSAVAFSGKVGTFFFHWYRCPDQPDLNLQSPGANACDTSNLKIKNIAPGMKKDDPYPEGGYYHSGNLNWYKREFSDMVNAGIDFALVVDLYQTSQISMMGQAITQLNLPLKLGFFWDPPAESPGIFDLSKTSDVEKLYREYVYPFYSALPRDLWVMYNNRPVILTVYVEQESHPEKARELFLYIKEKFKSDFGIEPWLVVDRSWWSYADLNGVADGRCNWGNTTETVEGFTVSLVGPGVDMRNTPWGGPNSVYIDRRNGDFFKEELAKVSPGANFLMISSWNELFENTGISRAINYKKNNGDPLPENYYMNILRGYLGKKSVNSSVVQSIEVPSKVRNGSSFNIKVNVLNNGYSFWTKKTLFRIGVKIKKGDNVVWEGRSELLSSQVVFPNSSVVYSSSLTAPNEYGTYTIEGQMLEENVEWFGNKLNSDFVVDRYGLDIKYLSSGWSYLKNSAVGTNCRMVVKIAGWWAGSDEKSPSYYKCNRAYSF